MPYHTFLYGPRWKMPTSAWSCTWANFCNDGAKNRHACKMNPKDTEAVSSTGDSTHHTRWQPLKKTIICNNSALYNTPLVHFKMVVAPMSHYKLPLLNFQWHFFLTFTAFGRCLYPARLHLSHYTSEQVRVKGLARGAGKWAWELNL